MILSWILLLLFSQQITPAKVIREGYDPALHGPHKAYRVKFTSAAVNYKR